VERIGGTSRERGPRKQRIPQGTRCRGRLSFRPFRGKPPIRSKSLASTSAGLMTLATLNQGHPAHLLSWVGRVPSGFRQSTNLQHGCPAPKNNPLIRPGSKANPIPRGQPAQTPGKRAKATLARGWLGPGQEGKRGLGAPRLGPQLSFLMSWRAVTSTWTEGPMVEVM
jgi:hypothetical protein